MTAADPDVDFTLADSEPAADLAERIASDVAALAPSGWTGLSAEFALTTTTERADVWFDSGPETVRTDAPASAVAAARALRAESAQRDSGPWWRLVVRSDPAGTVTTECDYGGEPFPQHHLFPPEAYRADLAAHPRSELPLWLSAYLNHRDRQLRSPRQAAAAARAGSPADVAAAGLPALPAMWARWATLAAAFVAVGSPLGPRIRPVHGWFEGSRRSGATLFILPGDRAVLSGGVWNAPELAAAYAADGPLPRIFAGAPPWVADPVLNPRAAGGLLSFCYWWRSGSWYSGESPAADRIGAALPGVWTERTVAEVIARLHDGSQPQAVTALVTAAEQAAITRGHLVDVFGAEADIDGAAYQLSTAGLLAAGAETDSTARATS